MLKRLLLTITLLWLWAGAIHIYAQSQYEIWFDSDYDNRSTATMTSAFDLTTSLQIDQLSAGLHCFNFRTIDNNGTYGLLHRKMFVYAPELSVPSNEMTGYEVWFDNDYPSREETKSTGTSISFISHVDRLAPGVHTLNFRAIGEGNTYGNLMRKMFVYAPELSIPTKEMIGYEVWFDNDYSSRETIPSKGNEVSFVSELEQLSPGVHTLNFRAIGEGDAYGNLMRKMFVYAPELSVASKEMTAYEMWIDNDYDSRTVDEATGSELTLTYDVSNLQSGLHTFNFRAIGQGNAPGIIMRKMIYLAPEESFSAYACEYSIDGGEPVSVDILGNGCDFSVDLSGMSDGNHTLSVRSQSSDGRWGPIFTRTFELSGIPLDASEWTLLLALHKELQTMGWSPEWNIEGGLTAASGFEGVEVTDGHVTGFSFNNKGLRSTTQSMIPLSMLSFPYLQNVNLSGNGLAGGVDKIFAAEALQGKSMALKTISSLNLSDNLFNGNLGILGARQVLPSLKTLNASRNGFADVYPAVPSTVDLDYSYQCIDRVIPMGYKELQDIDFKELIDIDFSKPESIKILEKLPPTITLYNHKLQTWLPPQAYVLSKADPDSIKAIEDVKEWIISLGWSEFGLYFPYLSEDFYVYDGKSGDILNAIVATTGTTGKLYNSGTHFKVKFNYEDGDVNLDGNVNVVDLQSIINYIFEIYNMQNVKPFIFNSANRQKADELIDIKDAVLMVSLLLDKNITSTTRSVETSPLAYNSGGYLCISSARPVAAFELTLLGDDDIRIVSALKRSGFTCEISRREGYSRVVAYSLDGNTLPAGVTQIGSIGFCDVADVVLSDAYAEVILESSDTTTGVNVIDADDSEVDIAYSNGVITITSPKALTNVKWTIFTVDGKVAACGEAESLAAGKSAIRCGMIADGVAMAVVEADQTPATRRKIMILNH